MIACKMLITAPLIWTLTEVKKENYPKMKLVNPNKWSKNQSISTQSNKHHAFHEQINILQNTSSLEKGGKRDVTNPCTQTVQ